MTFQTEQQMSTRRQRVSWLYGSGGELVVFFGNSLRLPQVGDVVVGKVTKLRAKLVELRQLILQCAGYLLPHHVKHLDTSDTCHSNTIIRQL